MGPRGGSGQVEKGFEKNMTRDLTTEQSLEVFQRPYQWPCEGRCHLRRGQRSHARSLGMSRNRGRIIAGDRKEGHFHVYFYADWNDSGKKGGIEAAERRKRGICQGVKSLGRWESHPTGGRDRHLLR